MDILHENSDLAVKLWISSANRWILELCLVTLISKPKHNFPYKIMVKNKRRLKEYRSYLMIT